MKIGKSIVIEKHPQTTVLSQAISMLLAILLAGTISALLIKTSGADVSKALVELYKGAFGSKQAFLETLVQATPLMFTSLAMIIAFQGRVFNIGGEGQFFAGAIATAWVCMNFAHLNPVVLWILILIAAALAGALWALLPGVLKAKLGVNEIIVTVMMNYIIEYILSYLLSGPWTTKDDFFLQSPRFAESTWFPSFFNSRLHLGFFIAILLAVVIFILLRKTTFGYKIRAFGDNPVASKYKGIKINQMVIIIMLISGAIAGIAGASELSGINHRLRLDISNNYGFMGILVALLGKLNPFGTLLASIIFGGLINGSTNMEIFANVPVAIVYCVQGIMLICVLALDPVAYYRVKRIKQ